MDVGTQNTKMQRVTQGFRSWICFRPQTKFWEGMSWIGPNRCSCSYSDGQPGFFFGLTVPVGCLHLVIRGHRYCFRCPVFTFCMFGSPDGGQSPQGLYWKTANKSHTTCNELAPMYQGQVRWGSETACGSKLHVFPARSICQSGLIHLVLVRSSWRRVRLQWRNEVCTFTASAH